jgi:cell wall-associated NlpC family hydrolase
MTQDRRQMSDNPSSIVRLPSSEAAQRATVVAEARSWIRTPYHNCADVKGAGVDCGMLLVRVFVDTGLMPGSRRRRNLIKSATYREWLC